MGTQWHNRELCARRIGVNCLLHPTESLIEDLGNPLNPNPPPPKTGADMENSHSASSPVNQWTWQQCLGMQLNTKVIFMAIANWYQVQQEMWRNVCREAESLKFHHTCSVFYFYEKSVSLLKYITKKKPYLTMISVFTNFDWNWTEEEIIWWEIGKGEVSERKDRDIFLANFTRDVEKQGRKFQEATWQAKLSPLSLAVLISCSCVCIAKVSGVIMTPVCLVRFAPSCDRLISSVSLTGLRITMETKSGMPVKEFPD